MKKIALLLCLMFLVSCGTTQKIDPATAETNRTSEQQLVDKHLTTVLREQLSGAYEVKGATFNFTTTEVLEGRECFAYKMENGKITEVFAIATDASVIYRLDGKDFVKIFDMN